MSHCNFLLKTVNCVQNIIATLDNHTYPTLSEVCTLGSLCLLILGSQYFEICFAYSMQSLVSLLRILPLFFV